MSLSFAGLLLLYTITSMYLTYRNKKHDYVPRLEGAKVPLMLVGAYMVVMSLWGQFTWPLPGSYNILFYDPLLSFGLVLLAFSISIMYKVKLEYSGFFGLLVGVMVIFYGIRGYGLGLTSAPMALLGLYFLYGAAGVFSYPVALIADRLPGLKKNPWVGWHVCLAIFWVFMLVASLVAGYIGISAIGGHLLSAP
jgi:putative membrane protein